MSRVIEMDLRIHLQTISDQQVVTIDLSEVSLVEWCLNLCLLNEGLVNELLFLGDTKLRIELNTNSDLLGRASISISSNEIRLFVQPEELGYWVSFYLKYYRDGVAEVDHIDVEALTTSSLSEEVYVVFKVKDSAPPMSGKEAQKIIDQYD